MSTKWEAEVGMRDGKRQSMTLGATRIKDGKELLFFFKEEHEGMGKRQRLSF